MHFKKRFNDIFHDERGVGNLITIIIILPVLLAITFSLVTYFVFIVKQMKLETLHFRALQMAEEEGYLTPDIINDTKEKMESLNMPETTIDGTVYPDFTGSTTSKVLKDDSDPTVVVTIKYPASNLDKIFMLIGGSNSEDNGFYTITAHGRSEAFE